MNWDKLQDRLLQAARSQPPRDQVPYAFATRVMARLRSAPEDPWPGITRLLWWSAAACSAIAIATSVWTTSVPAEEDFAGALEQTILAAHDEAAAGIDLEFLQ